MIKKQKGFVIIIKPEMPYYASCIGLKKLIKLSLAGALGAFGFIGEIEVKDIEKDIKNGQVLTTIRNEILWQKK